MISAIFFPTNPEALAFDLVQEASQAVRRGQRLFCNGRQLALLPIERREEWRKKGWHPFGGTDKQEHKPCSA